MRHLTYRTQLRAARRVRGTHDAVARKELPYAFVRWPAKEVVAAELVQTLG